MSGGRLLLAALAAGCLATLATLWGLPLRLALPVGAALVLALAVGMLRGSATSLAVVVVCLLVGAVVSEQLHPGWQLVVTASGGLTVLMSTCLPLVEGRDPPLRGIVTLAVTAAAVSGTIAAVSAAVGTEGLFAALLGLAAVGLAYWLAVPHRSDEAHFDNTATNDF